MYFVFQEGRLGLPDDDSKTVEYGAIPYEIAGQCDEAQPGDASTWLTILTSMFMHGSILHLGGNMLFLWIFGNNIEDSMSQARASSLFYLLGGVAALLGQTVVDTRRRGPDDRRQRGDGRDPRRLRAALPARPRGHPDPDHHLLHDRRAARPARARCVVRCSSSSTVPPQLAQPIGEGGGVAFFAHIGGFVFGLALIKLFATNVHEDYDRPAAAAGVLMSARTGALLAALALIGLLTFLTFSVLVREGIDVLVLVSLVILALFGFGVLGALSNPPND